MEAKLSARAAAGKLKLQFQPLGDDGFRHHKIRRVADLQDEGLAIHSGTRLQFHDQWRGGIGRQVHNYLGIVVYPAELFFGRILFQGAPAVTEINPRIRRGDVVRD